MKMYANMCELLHCCEVEHDIKTAQKKETQNDDCVAENMMIACWQRASVLYYFCYHKRCVVIDIEIY